MQILDWFWEVGLSGFLDIALMSLVIYTVLVWFKNTRAAAVMKGILVIAGLYVMTRLFNLTMTTAVFERFFAVILIALVVIFQEELRHFFERVAVWSFNQRITRRKAIRLVRNEVEILVRTLTDLAREKIGALIVLKGKDMIVRHLDGGVDLHGDMSEPLLKSIFDPHSIGHDGAVIVEGNQVVSFGVHLPLSKDIKKIGKGGTRHAAALGLAELKDALCLVVSEERGTISVARHGDLEEIKDPDRLTLILERFYQETNPKQQEKPLHDFYKRNSLEKVIALALAIALWFVLVYGSKLTYKTFGVPVTSAGLPKAKKIAEINPGEVDVTFRGPRRAFYFVHNDAIRVIIKPKESKASQRIYLSSNNIVFPKKLVLENIEPREVSVKLEEVSDEKSVQKT